MNKQIVYIPTYKSSNLKVGIVKKDFYEDFQSETEVETKITEL